MNTYSMNVQISNVGSYLTTPLGNVQRIVQVLEGPGTFTNVVGPAVGPRFLLCSNVEAKLNEPLSDPSSVENGELTCAITDTAVTFAVDTRNHPQPATGKRWQWVALRIPGGGTNEDLLADVRMNENPGLLADVNISTAGPGQRTVNFAFSWTHLPTQKRIVTSLFFLGQPFYPQSPTAAKPPMFLNGVLAGGPGGYLWVSVDMRSMGIGALCTAMPVGFPYIDPARIAREALVAYGDLARQVFGTGGWEYKDFALGYLELGCEIEGKGRIELSMDTYADLVRGGWLPKVGDVLA